MAEIGAHIPLTEAPGTKQGRQGNSYKIIRVGVSGGEAGLCCGLYPQGLMLKLLPALNSQRLHLETGPLERRLGTRGWGYQGVLIEPDKGPIRTDQNTGTHRGTTM